MSGGDTHRRGCTCVCLHTIPFYLLILSIGGAWNWREVLTPTHCSYWRRILLLVRKLCSLWFDYLHLQLLLLIISAQPFHEDRQLRNAEIERSSLPRGWTPSWLSRTRWSALKLYILVTLNGLNRLYSYLTVTEKEAWFLEGLRWEELEKGKERRKWFNYILIKKVKRIYHYFCWRLYM